MTSSPKRRDKVRVQVDLTPAEATLLRLLEKRLSVRSRADLLQQAYGTFLWIIDEMLAGRRVVSVGAETLEQMDRYKELCVPAVEPLRFGHYQYLVSRPETGREQLYLKGRNITAGQLVYKMRANQMTDEQAATDMDLPLEQVREAMAYYQIHRQLIESEIEEEKQHLLSQGIELEPVTLPG